MVPEILKKTPDPRRRARRLALLGLLAFAAWTVFGGDQGLVSLALSWKERFFLSREIETLKAENSGLASEAERLGRQPAQVEKTAREKLMLKKNGELIYRFDHG